MPASTKACRHGFSADILTLKTASYAVMHLVVAIAVAYALTLDWRKALAIGIVVAFAGINLLGVRAVTRFAIPVALTAAAEASLASMGASSAVISVVSANGVAASTGPITDETAPTASCSGGGTFTGEGGNGAPCTGTGSGIVTPAPRLTPMASRNT